MSTLLADIETGFGWLNFLLKAVIGFINPVLIVASVAGIFYAIVVGIKFMKADDKSAREEAKQKLISVIIGIVVTIVLIILFYFLAFNVGDGKLINTTQWAVEQPVKKP